jgi:hypothetical protein
VNGEHVDDVGNKSNDVGVRHAQRLGLVIVLAFTGLVLFGIDASGKMAFRYMTIQGPGLARPIRLAGNNLDAMAFWDMTGYTTLLYKTNSPKRLTSRPTDELGPRYTVTYFNPLATARGMRLLPIVEHVYPFAEPNPVVYMAPGQRRWHDTSVGGWFVANAELTREMEALGVPSKTASAPSQTDNGAEAVAVYPGPVEWSLGLLIGLVVLAAIMWFIGRAASRRRVARASIG